MSNLDTSPLAVGRLRNAPNRIHQGFFCHLVVFYPLREPRYNPFKGTFEDVDLFFPRWDRLVSWRGNIFLFLERISFFQYTPQTNIGTYKNKCFQKTESPFSRGQTFSGATCANFPGLYLIHVPTFSTFLHLVGLDSGEE